MAHLMDPDEWDEDTAAMAEAMGFASFGGQSHGSKRRKYNARADDAFVAGGDESTLPFHDAGSGSNNTPLGERRPQQQPAAKKQKTNANEIDLDDDDDDDDEDQQGVNGDGNTSAAAAGASKEADDAAQDPEPQYIDTSQPPNQAQPGLPAKPTWGPYAGRGEGHTQPGRPNRPRHGGGGGDRNSQEPWWNDYYDPAFNTNPWEQIEKAQGMEPRGTWLSYDESKAKWAAIRSQAASSSLAPATAEAVAQAA